MMPKYRKYLGWGKLMEIINKIISNSHVGGDPIGSGIYVFSSLTNHDCNNNCTFWTEKSKLNLAAFKKIHKGEEISISYINETYKPKEQRQNLLNFRGFQCLCSRCKSEREIVRLCVADCCQSSMLQSIGEEDYQCLVCYKKFLNYEKISLENEKNVVNIHKLHYLNFEILN